MIRNLFISYICKNMKGTYRKELIIMTYKTTGVCCQEITFEVEENIIQKVYFKGGCSGNTQGLSKLLEGMDVDDVIKRLEGTKCGNRATSCPDQLSRALKEWRV
jgi:uncharacterized protein (TIGR03905 family)